MKYYLLFISALMILGCQPDPGEKLIPRDDKKVVNKGLNNVSFNPAVDILFVVDDSGSMGSFQENMAQNAQRFVEEIFKSKFIDYHIGVTSSTPGGGIFGTGSNAPGGKLMVVDDTTFVTRKTAGGEQILAGMLNVGTSGTATEEFFSIPELTFSGALINGHNKGFYRPDAFLAVFLVTDADDQSDLSVAGHEGFLLGLKNQERSKIHYTAAIVDQVITSNCNRSGEPFPRKIKELVNAFSGDTFELCNSNYGESMAKVAQRIVKGVSTIYLDELPDVTTLEVTYGGVPLPQGRFGWSYDPDENAINLSPDTKINEDQAAKLNVKFEAVYK